MDQDIILLDYFIYYGSKMSTLFTLNLIHEFCVL